MKHIIFDFDGVLADSFNFHLERINTLFNIDLTADEYRDRHNGNIYTAHLKKMEKFNGEQYSDLVAKEQERLPLPPGALDVLKKLQAQFVLHIISSGWEGQIRPFLKYHDIEKYFTTLLFADHGKLKSEKFGKIFAEQNIKPSDCLFVTDTLGDLIEAHSVNVPSIAVTFGFHDVENLMKGNPTHVAHDWSQIEKYISEHFK